jgi:sugar O-acyltransferase (sialic acid O-acetyltransferase NeuD family)
MDEIIIFGNSDFAKLVHFYFEHYSTYKVVAFTVDRNYVTSNEFNHLPLIPFDEIIQVYPPSKYKIFIAIGYKFLNKIRSQKYLEAKKKGYGFVSYIHPTSTISKDAKIGSNCFIFENVTVQPFVKIGNSVLIWSGSIISHNVTIEDNCYISPGVTIAGESKIKKYCFLGVNSTIRNKIEVSKECIIGMGAVVLGDTIEKSVYVGNPARLSSTDSSKTKL